MSLDAPNEQEQPVDTMFQDAVDALRRGDKARAREILTLLLKTDQKNPTYWVWLSAAMETQKERVYCLQTALNLDPQNGTAKRGLILLGALPPDETIQPFSLNRPRIWEEKLLLASEKPKEKGFKAMRNNPAFRLAGITLLGLGLCAAVVFGFVLPRQTTIRPTQTNTPGPSPTFSATPTLFGATAPPTSVPKSGQTPLAALLPATYTPTALYVNTPRAPQSVDQYRLAKAAFEKGDWDLFIQNMQLIAQSEPESADVQYYIGEAYRFKGESSAAIKAYNAALQIDPEFGAAYLGLARARLLGDPGLNVEFLFDEAIKRDPNFPEIYIERAHYFIYNKKYKDALKDLDRANELRPDSPQIYLAYAETYLALGDRQQALEAAKKAYSLDITMLPVYRMLGDLYIENEEYVSGLDALLLYVAYVPDDPEAFALIGKAYFAQKDYRSAVEYFDKAYRLSPRGLRKYYVYRGTAHLELGNIEQAVSDLEDAVNYDETSFDANYGLVRAYYIQEKFGSAFLKVTTINSLAKTKQQIALALYWRALIQEKRGETKAAIKDWQELLGMDAAVMTAEMRAEALKHLTTLVTPTNTPKGGIPTGTPTRTPTPSTSSSPAPSKSPTPKP